MAIKAATAIWGGLLDAVERPGGQNAAVIDAQGIGAEPVAHFQIGAEDDAARSMPLNKRTTVNSPMRFPRNAIPSEVELDIWYSQIAMHFVKDFPGSV